MSCQGESAENRTHRGRDPFTDDSSSTNPIDCSLRVTNCCGAGEGETIPNLDFLIASYGNSIWGNCNTE